jgi:hypothetical protein
LRFSAGGGTMRRRHRVKFHWRAFANRAKMVYM